MGATARGVPKVPSLGQGTTEREHGGPRLVQGPGRRRGPHGQDVRRVAVSMARRAPTPPPTRPRPSPDGGVRARRQEAASPAGSPDDEARHALHVAVPRPRRPRVGPPGQAGHAGLEVRVLPRLLAVGRPRAARPAPPRASLLPPGPPLAHPAPPRAGCGGTGGRLVRVPHTRVVLGLDGPALRALEGPPGGPLVRRRTVGVVAEARPVPHVAGALVLRVGHGARVLGLPVPRDVLVVVRGPVPTRRARAAPRPRAWGDSDAGTGASRLGGAAGPPRPGVQVHEGRAVGGDRPRVPPAPPARPPAPASRPRSDWCLGASGCASSSPWSSSPCGLRGAGSSTRRS